MYCSLLGKLPYNKHTSILKSPQEAFCEWRGFSSVIQLNCHAWNEYSHHYLSQRMHTSLLWSWLHPNLSVGQGYFRPHYFSPVQTLACFCDGRQPFFSPTGLQMCIYISTHQCASQKCPTEKTYSQYAHSSIA